MTEDKASYDVDGKQVITMIGHIDTVKKVMSRSIVQVVIELPVEMFKPAVQYFDGENVFVQVVSDEMKDLPLGIHKEDEPDSIPPLHLPESKTPIRGNCIEAINFCQDPDFQLYMSEVLGTPEISEADSKDELCIRCNVDSRKEFDTNAVAHNAAQDIYRQFIDWNTKRKDHV